MYQTIFDDAYAKYNGQVWNPSFKEFSEQECQVVQDKNKAKLVFHGKLEDNSRASPMKVIERDGIVLDFDHAKVDITKRIKEALEGYEYTLTNTHSHDPDNNDHCYRGLIATTESIKKDYKSVYWNLVLDNPKLKAMHDEGILDVRGEDEARCFFTQSIPSERKDKAFKLVREGTPYKPIYRKREKPNSVSSNDKSVKIMADYFKDEIVLGGTGQRNGFEAKEIGKLIREHGDKETVIKEMLYINETRISPPEPTKEIIRQVESIWNKEIKNNPELSKPTPKRRSYTIAEYEALPPTEWLVYNLIEDKSMNAIYGASGSTKSFLAIDLGMHLALGMDWFGYEVYKPIPVIYVAVEGGGGLLKRIKGWIKTHKNMTPKNFIIDRDVIKPKDPKSIQSFIDEYKDRGKNSMIIVDTLNANARSSGIEENSSEMGLVVDAFQKINNALNSSYTLIHHTGKDETKGMRGHTSVHASMDTILYVQKKDSGCTWSLEKLKEGEDGISYSYDTEVVETTKDTKGNMQTTLVVKPKNLIQKEEKRIEFRGNQKTIWRMIRDYLLPIVNHRADIDSILDSIYESWAEHKSDKRKHDARKAITQLKNKGVLDTGAYIDPDTREKEHDQIWITKKGLNY